MTRLDCRESDLIRGAGRGRTVATLRRQTGVGKVRRGELSVEAIAAGFRSDSRQDELTAREDRRSDLAAELADAPSLPARLLPNLSQVYRHKVDDLQEALQDVTIRDEALDVLRGLIDRVIMHPADRGFGVEFVGKIAGTVELGQQKRAALPEDHGPFS